MDGAIPFGGDGLTVDADLIGSLVGVSVLFARHRTGVVYRTDAISPPSGSTEVSLEEVSLKRPRKVFIAHCVPCAFSFISGPNFLKVLIPVNNCLGSRAKPAEAVGIFGTALAHQLQLIRQISSSHCVLGYEVSCCTSSLPDP